MSNLVEMALDAIRVIDATNRRHKKATKHLALIHQDFQWLSPIPSAVEAALVKILDEILGDDLASYYLYQSIPGGGLIEENGRTWPIRTVDDIAAYIKSRG